MIDDTEQKHWLSLTFYMENSIVSGDIRQPSGLRLTEYFNQVDERNGNGINTFIEVNNANTVHEYYVEESQSTTYINRDCVELVVAEDGDVARGIGASIGSKPYPFVKKSPVKVVVETPSYTLSGLMHCSCGQIVGDVLHTKTKFLPMTDVNIKSHGQNTWSPVPFAALNRGKVLSLSQERDYM